MKKLSTEELLEIFRSEGFDAYIRETPLTEEEAQEEFDRLFPRWDKGDVT